MRCGENLYLPMGMRLRTASYGTPLRQEVKDSVRRRSHFTPGRSGGRIRAPSIRLADVSGPRDGADEDCEIRVSLGS